jgi:hypothetical protein
MHRLSNHLIKEHIIPYTYNPQPKELCDDIKSFYNVRKHLLKIYHDQWEIYFEFEKDADINWLENDILRYYNNDLALMNGYHINFTNKIKKLFMLNKKDDVFVNKIISSILNSNPKRIINVLLALLTHEERILLVDFCEASET